MGVVHVVEGVYADLAHQEIGTVDISAGDVPPRLLEKHARIFIEVARADAVDDLFDAQAVAVIDVLDGRAVGGDGADQLVTQVVGVVLYRLGCAGCAVGIGCAEGLLLVTIVIVGVVDAIGEGPVDAFLDRQQSVIGVVCVRGGLAVDYIERVIGARCTGASIYYFAILSAILSRSILCSKKRVVIMIFQQIQVLDKYHQISNHNAVRIALLQFCNCFLS